MKSKNHLKDPCECLRSKTPELVIQEFYGYLLTHFTIRSLMHQAALKNDCDPDALSFTDAVRIVRRKITAAHFPSGQWKLKNCAGKSWPKSRSGKSYRVAGYPVSGRSNEK